MGAIKIFLVLLVAALAACSTISVQSPEGYHASYTRLGDQSIQGLRFEKDELGVVRIVFEKQASEARVLDAISALIGAAR